MKNSNAPIDDKFIETLQRIIKETQGKDVTREYAMRVIELTELIMKIASGEFECSKCGEKFKPYIVGKQ